MEVQVARVGVTRVAKAVHDQRRHQRHRPRRHHHVLAVEAEHDGQLALQDVEDVVVMAVDVQIRACTTGGEPRPRRVEGLVVAEDLHPPLRRVADDLAPAGRDDGRLAHGSSLRTGGSRHACEPLRHCGLAMVPLWCHTDGVMDLTPVRRQPPPRARGRRRGRRRGRPRAGRAAHRAARVGDPADAARRAVGRRGRDHPRARPRLGRGAPARARARVRGDAAAGRRAGRAGARRRAPPALPDGDEARDGAHQPAPARAPQGRHRGGRQPRGAVGQRLARARRRRRARARRPPTATSAAGAGRRSATPAGCADPAPVRFRNANPRLRT